MSQPELVRLLGGPRDGERIAYAGGSVRLSRPVEGDTPDVTVLDWHRYEYEVVDGEPAYVHKGEA